jgi:hypothetical protein
MDLDALSVFELDGARAVGVTGGRRVRDMLVPVFFTSCTRATFVGASPNANERAARCGGAVGAVGRASIDVDAEACRMALTGVVGLVKRALDGCVP